MPQPVILSAAKDLGRTSAVRLPRSFAALRMTGAALIVAILGVDVALAGSIRATVKAEKPIRKVWAVQREQTSLGTMAKPFDGAVLNGKLFVENVPPGRYDLKFQFDEGT